MYIYIYMHCTNQTRSPMCLLNPIRISGIGIAMLLFSQSTSNIII